MRTYNEFSALWRAAAFNRDFYQDVARNWRGIGARYLLLLEILVWLAVLIKATFGINNFMRNEAAAALERFPTIHIAKGVASSDVAQPYILNDDEGKPFFVLDTTGEVKEPSDVGARVLLTDKELIQDNRGVVERRPLRDMPDMTVSRQLILDWIRYARNGLIPVGTPLCAGTLFGVRLVMALLFAAIGLAISSGFEARLSYAALLRLSVMSMSLPVLADTLLDLAGVPSGCGIWLLFQLLTFVYLVYGIKVAAAVPPSDPYAVEPPSPSSPVPPMFPDDVRFP